MAATGQTTRWLAFRRRVHEVMEIGGHDDRLSRWFDGLMITLILANMAAFCAETVHEIEVAYGYWFHLFEVFSVGIFTIEYILRVWHSVEMPFLSRLTPWQARLRFMRRSLQIADLLAFLPFYLGHVFGLDLRILRAFRLLRLFKLSRYSPAMHTLIRVIASEGRALTGAAILLLAALLFSSTGMYFIEGHVQPDKFGSVPLAAYWAMTTLTTVGYGDVVPVTALGKFWAMITMLFGLCILALPVAIISTGFAHEVGRRDFVITWSLMARIPLFAGLDAAHVAEVMPMLHAHNLPPNIEIIRAGSHGDAMYFLSSGRVRLHAPGGVAEFKAGDYFGIVAMIENTVHPGRFVTTTRCRVLKLYREDFYRLEAANPVLGARIREVANERRKLREAGETVGGIEAA